MQEQKKVQGLKGSQGKALNWAQRLEESKNQRLSRKQIRALAKGYYGYGVKKITKVVLGQ